MNADFISREDALEVVLPHLLDVEKEGGPGLGQIALVQTPQIFYNRNVLVSAFAHPTTLCMFESLHKSIDQPINESITHSTIQSTNQPKYQSINQTISSPHIMHMHMHVSLFCVPVASDQGREKSYLHCLPGWYHGTMTGRNGTVIACAEQSSWLVADGTLSGWPLEDDIRSVAALTFRPGHVAVLRHRYTLECC